MFDFGSCKPHPVLAGVTVCDETISTVTILEETVFREKDNLPVSHTAELRQERGADTILALL